MQQNSMYIPLMDTADVHKGSLIEVDGRHLPIADLQGMHQAIRKMVTNLEWAKTAKRKSGLEMSQQNLSRIVEWKFMLHQSNNTSAT